MQPTGLFAPRGLRIAALAALFAGAAAAQSTPGVQEPGGQPRGSTAPKTAAVQGRAPDATTAGVMGLLARHGLHDLKDEAWNAYAQLTYISSWKPSFSAQYTNLNGSINSLLPDPERSYTGTFTLFLGLKPWPGAEAYYVPEIIAERAFSQLRGLAGAIQNFELQKTGVESPQVYRSRLYLSQTFGFGGGSVDKPSGQMQLAGTVDRRRLVLTAGNFSILDFFDKNSFTSDTRQQFLGLGFMTHAAWDFASDARGYSWGGLAELYYDDWAIRLGRISPPKNPNQLPVGLRLDRYYGDQLEIEHVHQVFGLDGAVKLIAYRNRELMGRFDDAVAALQADPGNNAAACTSFNYGSGNATAPDLCWARKPNIKVGIGFDIEQHVTADAGLFARGMFSDGQTEVQAYTSSDRSINFGALSKGTSWGRPADLAGIGAGFDWISSAHAEYLRQGGIDGFIGDGSLLQATEEFFEVFYSVNFLRIVWLSGDYQHVWNPAFNADRGPVNVFSLRLHAQF